MTTIGSLFSGYRGLDMAVEALTGADTVWCSDIDPGANAILAHHWPDVPNLGDISRIDFEDVAPVDILTGGFPCQDVSAAGKRAGLVRYGDKNRSGLWAEMARAVDTLRPQLVVAENVRGLLSAKTDTDPDLFDCLACMAAADAEPMRALGAVVGDLAAIGYDAAWHGVRASDVGAPHQRFRIFVIAWPTTDSGSPGLAVSGASGQCPASDNCGARATATGSASPALKLLPTPDAYSATRGGAQHPDKRRAGGHSVSLADVIEKGTDWGVYEPAVRRWESVTRPAPEPKGISGHSPAFVEWMMGLPAGHVTAVPGLTRKQQLKALGNGVVPQQAMAAISHLLAAVTVAA